MAFPTREAARVRLALPLVVVMFAAAASARANDEDQPPSAVGESLKLLSLEALGNIEVTTLTKEPEEIRRVPAAVYVITQDDIRRSGASSFPEILRLAPGVNVSRIDSDHWSVGIRGFGDQFSKSVLVLIDGRSIYTPLFAGVMWGVQDTALEDIERIEVIRGPGGTIWGANAVDGVINIITRKASETHGGRVSVGTGNIDRVIVDARYGGGYGEHLDYRVYMRGFDREPESHADSIAFDDWHNNQAGFRADWTHDRNSLTVQGDVYKGQNGQSVSIGSIAPPRQTVHYEPLDVSGGNLFGHWQRTLNTADHIQVQGYYDRTYFLGPQIGESRHTFDVDFLHHIANRHRQAFTWGVGARQSLGHIIQTVPTLDITPHDQTDHVSSVFAQDELTAIENRLRVTLGTKLEHNNYTGFEWQPSARLLWMPAASQSIWAAATRAVRTPSRLEEDFRYQVFVAAQPLTFVTIAGNQDFQSERRVSYEAGYRRQVSNTLQIDLSLFHTRLDNLESLGTPTLSTVTAPPAYLLLTFPFANGVMGASNGFEIVPNWRPLPTWQITASYSYLNLDLRNSAGSRDTSAVTTYEGSSPRHQGRIQSRVDFANGWQADVAWRRVGALPARGVHAYGTVDVRVGRQSSNHVRWSIVGQNLAHRSHLEFGHDPGPPVAILRSVYASITWER